MRADARIDHSLVKPLCIRLRFELDRMVHDARRAKVVVLAADGNDKGVIVEGPLGRDFATFSIEIRRHLHLTPVPIDSDHVADAVTKAVPVGLREIVDLVGGDIHAPGGNFVELRLPHMRAVSLDQRNVELPLASVSVAQAGRKLQSSGSTSDDHNPGTVGQLGLPIKPGTSCWTGRIGKAQVLGLAVSELAEGPGAVDLLLPRLLLGEALEPALIADLAVGGLVPSLLARKMSLPSE